MAAADDVRALVTRADELLKAASNRPDPAVARDAAREKLGEASDLLQQLDDAELRDELVVLIGRRRDDLGALERAEERDGPSGSGGTRTIELPQPDGDTVEAPLRRPDGERVPPGQHTVRGLPVLHVGRIPDTTREDFRLRVTGEVEGRRHDLDWAAVASYPEVTITTDIHCVTAWSRLDVSWTGIRPRDLLEDLGAHDGATHALVYGANAYSANLDRATLWRDDVLLAWACDGEPLTPEHGAPLRLVVPSRYFWKSTKWVDTIQLLDRDVPGYWEARGYHNVADPFREQRYA